MITVRGVAKNPEDLIISLTLETTIKEWKELFNQINDKEYQNSQLLRMIYNSVIDMSSSIYKNLEIEK